MLEKRNTLNDREAHINRQLYKMDDILSAELHSIVRLQILVWDHRTIDEVH